MLTSCICEDGSGGFCAGDVAFPSGVCGRCGERYIQPQPGPQSEFLACDATYALFGGGVGSGKTFALLMDWLRYVEHPQANGLLVRHTLADIQKGGSAWDQAKKLYRGTAGVDPAGELLDPHSRGGNILDIRWPSGALLTFGYLKSEEHAQRYKGPGFTWIGVEEINECPMEAVIYLMSRMRSTSRLRPVMRWTCNPDPDHPVADWVEPYLDEGGYPRREMSGRKFWALRSTITDRHVFGDTPDEVAKIAGSDPARAQSFAFIPALLEDNIAVNREEYRRSLAQLSITEREKLEDGCWRPTRRVGGMLSGTMWRTVTEPLSPIVLRIRAWDLASSRPRPEHKDPDYAIGLLVQWDRHGRWYVSGMAAGRDEADGIERILETTVTEDGIHVVQGVEREGGSMAKLSEHDLRRRFRALVPGVKCLFPRANKSKIEKLKIPARELRLGMRGDIPRDIERPDDDPIPWSPRGMLLVDPDDDWTQKPYSDKGSHPPTLGALWRKYTHNFPHSEHDDPADALGIAHVVKRMIDKPKPRPRRLKLL